MEPDLWKGAISAVPFVDVVTTMLDPSIPLTSNEDEWVTPEKKNTAIICCLILHMIKLKIKHFLIF